jgi:hypothetical protein
LQQSALVAFNDLSLAAGKSRALSEGHCGGGVVRVLMKGTVNHLQVCPVIGRNSAPHDVVGDVLSHLVVQNGVTDAAVVETRHAAADEKIYDADVVYFDPSSRARIMLEVSIVTIGSGTSLGRGARAGLDGVNAQLRAREEEKRNHDVVRRRTNILWWGFATEGVCLRGGPYVAKADIE